MPMAPVRVKEDLGLHGLGLQTLPEPVGGNTVAHLRGKFLPHPQFQQEPVGLFTAHLGMAQGGIPDLIDSANVVEQTGGDENVVVHILAFGNLQGVIQHPVHMIGAVGPVIHGLAHIIFQQAVLLSRHHSSSR